MFNVIITLALCGILVVLILILCLIFAVVGFLVGYNKILAKEPKNEPPPLSAKEKAKMEREEKKMLREMQNFWNYTGDKQEEII